MDLGQEALSLFGHFPPQNLENQSSPITALAPRARASNFTVCKKCEGISGPSVSVLPTSRMVDMPLIFASHRVVCRCGFLTDRFGEVTMLFAGIQDDAMKAAEA
jgi:hypothetical protein